MPKIYDNLLIIGGKNQIPLLVFTQSNYDPILYVAETGNVGIGLTPSHYRFEVSGTVSTNGFRMPTGATSGYVLTSFDNEGNANWQAPKIRKYFVSGFTFSENVTRTINHNLGTEGISVTLWDNINDTNISGLLSNRTNDSVDITLTSDFPFPGVDVIITGADSTGQDSVIMPTDLAVDDLTIEIYNNKIRLKQNVDVAYDYSDNVVARQFSGSIQHGSANSATGQNSHAEGYNTTASGTGSHAEGYKSNSIGQSSHAEGGSYINDENGGTSIGDGSHAEGFNTTTLGYGSHAEGFGTVTGIPNDNNENYYSHAEGIISKAYARGSHAEGYNTTVIENSWFGHSEGYETVVGGLGGGHSEGWKTTVLGDSSHTEGSYTTTLGNWSHAEGHYTKTNGTASHAEGHYTTTLGEWSHSEGNYTTSVGTYSHSEGINTTSSSYGSHAEGHSNLAGIRKFDCYINNGLVRIINGVDYTPDFTSGVVLLSNGLTYSYSTSSCTYSTPVFSFQLDDTSFMTSTETDFFNYEAGQVSNIRAILYTPNSIFNNNDLYYASYSFGGDRYTAGITMNLNLKLVVTNLDNDFPDLLTITVPNGWKINSASPYIGLESWNYNGITYSVYDYYNDPNFWNYDGPPKGEPFMGLSNNDKTATWGFNNDVYGGIWNYTRASIPWLPGDAVISPDGTYDIVLNVTIDEWVSGIQTLNFFLSTSSYDTDLTNGVLNLQPEGLWVVDSSNLANIKGTPIGNGSHAEGFQTTSIGDYSHTGGIGTIAMSEGQFSIGKWNTATNSNNLFVIGNGTSSSNRSDLAIFKDDSITFNKSLILKDGTHGNGKILVSDANGVASWTFSSSLFETNGIVGEGTQNYLSKFTGTNSISDSQIFDDGSTVTIRSGLQIGSASVVSGAYGFAEGYQTTALGTGSHAEGYRSTAIGDCSHAEGGSQWTDDMGSTSIGHGSHAEGINTTSVGNYSHSEGEATTSIGYCSHTEGSGTTTYGWFSHAEGNATTAYDGSHSEGLLTKAIGNSSHSEGIWTLSIGAYSHSEGNTNVVAYSNSHVEGMYNVVGKAYKSFDYDNLLKKLRFSGNIVSEFSIGDTLDLINPNPNGIYDNIFIGLTISSVTFSSPNTEIVINTALGIGYNGFAFTVVNRTKSIDSGLLSSHAEGINNIAFGNGSHAEGYNTISIGTYSHSEGIGTIAYSEGQHAIGKWNTATNSTDLFVIGNGTSDLNRSDLAKFATDSITFNKSLILKDGTQGPGKILVSDSNGLASWTQSIYGITGSGTTNYLSKFTGTNSISNSRISDDGQTVSINSKVQIGTGSIAIGSYSYSEGNQNISGYKAFLANVDNGLITIANGIDYTSEFTSGDVYLISTYNNQILYPRKSYSIYSVTFSSPTFSLQLEDNTIGGGGSLFIVDIENLNSDLATNTFGDYSHSEGQYTNALGFNSHSEGEYTRALGLNSHAEGQYTYSYGQSSHAEGTSNVAIGAWSHVEGNSNTSKGNSSHAEGSNTKSIGNISHAEGQLTKSIGQSSHAEGYNTISGYVGFNVLDVTNGLIRIYSDVDCSYLFTSSFVYLDNVKYQYSSINYNSPDFTIQLIDTSVNSGSLVVDIDHLYHDLSTDIFGDYTHAEGKDTKALGQNSHAEGYNTTALGNNSHAQGIGTIAISEAQFVTGKWNAATNSSDLFVIGNGSSNTNRSDLANFSNDVIKFNTNLLHQLGSFRLEDGTQGPGKILVSDSNGLASWTASVTYGSVNKYESLNVSITMGVTQSFTHSLNSTSIITQIWDNDSGEIIYGKFFNRQPNSVDLVLSNTYTSVDIIIMS